MRYATKWLLKSVLLSSMLLLTVLALAHGGHDKKNRIIRIVLR